MIEPQTGDKAKSKRHSAENCIFCKIIGGQVSDFIIRENDDIIVILSLEGHPLIIPKEHIDCLCELTPELASQIMVEAVTMAKAVRETTGCTGLNLIQSNGADAGQEVFHFHLHVRPRWEDDGIEATWNTAEPGRGSKTDPSRQTARIFRKMSEE